MDTEMVKVSLQQRVKEARVTSTRQPNSFNLVMLKQRVRGTWSEEKPTCSAATL